MDKKNLLIVIIAPAIAVILFFISVTSGVVAGMGSLLETTPSNCERQKSFLDHFDLKSYFMDTSGSCTNVCEVGVFPPGIGGTLPGGNVPGTGLKEEQIVYVQKIIGTGKALGVPDKGIITALTVALVESNLKLYANDGIYDTRRNPADKTQAGNTALFAFAALSLNYPHDAVGSDVSSVGLFQQQAWWGAMGPSTWQSDPEATMARLMDPVFGSQKFYNSLLAVKDWENMSVGPLAQKVQVSAFPDAYRKREDEATQMYAKFVESSPELTGLYPIPGQRTYEGKTIIVDDSKATVDVCGGGNLPLDKSRTYAMTAQYAQPRARPHQGIDIDCGDDYENVYSMTQGTVVMSVTGNSSGKGTPMGQVNIQLPDGSIIEYLHGRTTFATVGSDVRPGQLLMECASTGNSTGTHLHINFKVKNTDNATLLGLPQIVPGHVDAALAMEVLGVNICPPYVENRKQVAAGSSLPSFPLVCFPKSEWVR